MKKLFMFLMVVGLTTLGISCGSDDNGGDDTQGGKKTLVLKADKLVVGINESVTFTITVDSSEEEGAELYIGNNKITNPYAFDQVGDFDVVAKKNGFNDSNVVKIKVTDEEPGPVETALVLTATPNGGDVEVGTDLIFIFTDANGDQVADVQLLKDGVAIPGDSYTIVADDAEKTLKFTGTKDGVTSNEVVYNVLALPPIPDSNFVRVGTSSVALNSVGLYYFRQDGSIYQIEEEGKKYTVFRATAFNDSIEGTIEPEFHNNSAGYTFLVELNANDSIRLPWEVDEPGQILIAGFSGAINGVDFDVENADFYNPVFGSPDSSGIGNVVLKVENGVDSVSGLDVELQFDGYYEAFYAIDLPPSEGSSRGHAKSLNLAKYAKDLKFKNLKQIRIR